MVLLLLFRGTKFQNSRNLLHSRVQQLKNPQISTLPQPGPASRLPRPGHSVSKVGVNLRRAGPHDRGAGESEIRLIKVKTKLNIRLCPFLKKIVKVTSQLPAIVKTSVESIKKYLAKILLVVAFLIIKHGSVKNQNVCEILTKYKQVK